MQDESLIAEIAEIAAANEVAGAVFDTLPLQPLIARLRAEASAVGAAWSGSWIGYHGRVYLEDFQRPAPGVLFDVDYGLQQDYANRTRGPWRLYEMQEVIDAIEGRAGVQDLGPLEDASKRALTQLQQAKEELLPLIDALLVEREDDALRRTSREIKGLEEFVAPEVFARVQTPKNFSSRDALAMNQMTQRVPIPPHIYVASYLLSLQSPAQQLKKVAQKARYVERYLRRRGQVQATRRQATGTKVFIGHGHVAVWKDLRDFLRDRLGLDYEEFNRTSAAGMATTERLSEMLDNANFAFLVLTAEDLHADHTCHARENVTHEAGLFQGRLGFRKAIMLLEDGCEEFSNIVGLGQIRFRRDNLAAKYDEIRAVLEREGIIRAP